MTPGAVVREIASGTPVAACLARVSSDAAELGAMGLPLRRVLTALRTYGTDTTPEQEAFAGQLLHSAIEHSVTAGFDQIRVRQADVSAALAAAYAQGGPLLDLLSRYGRVLQGQFGAHDFRVYSAVKGSDADQATPPAAVRVTAGEYADLCSAIEIDGGRSRLALERDWGRQFSSLWSMPLYVCRDYLVVLQLGFAAPRLLGPADACLLDAAISQCGAAIGQVEHQRRLRSLSLRLLETEDDERRRISRDLHDEAAQSLAVARLQLELIESALPKQVKLQLAEVRTVLESTIVHVRRLISDLSPPVLEQLGLAAALRQFVNRFRPTFAGDVTFRTGDLPEIESQAALVIYRALQQCLGGIRHASTPGNINVSIDAADRVLSLTVEYIGGANDKKQGKEEYWAHMRGIEERLGLLGGRLTLESTRIRGGKETATLRLRRKIRIDLPIDREKP
jgi:signal transduction histidine kinase